MTAAIPARLRLVLASMMSVILAVGLSLSLTGSAEATTRVEKRQYLQLLAAQEKLSYDVLTELNEIHPGAGFSLTARAEAADLARIRELLRQAGWRDLTAGDRRGDFTRYPLLEQMYNDLIFDGQRSIGDSARVGMALQQMSLATMYQIFDAPLTTRERQQLTYNKAYASNRFAQFVHLVSIYG